jgi:hypothetical protein
MDNLLPQATENYHYRSFLGTILTFANDAAASHLTNDFWYLDKGNMQPCDPTKAESTNKGFIIFLDRI